MSFIRHQFDDAGVRALLIRSEGRVSPHGPGTKAGHAGGRHVAITRQGLNDRDLNPATAFLTLADQARAATAALNHHQGQGAYDFLMRQARTGRRVILEAAMPTTPVRCGTVHRNWTQPMAVVCLILDRLAQGDGDGFHIHTCYPVLEYRVGCPSWWVEGTFQFPSGNARRP
ncbi:hypothetical protein [Limnoglobus roseus]|uniref:Uncharacterized protein n=1 Tax=Limnoglobus roseus TaxID=2598579 RepID=A0A5C1AG31_9BACT|nr:hypothetical protein [Limnoglobus roseus]QEL18171.1 hypothetical protein PX52LOC_05185 [Limnoglobus roseus]